MDARPADGAQGDPATAFFRRRLTVSCAGFFWLMKQSAGRPPPNMPYQTIKEFQAARELQADGVVGPVTWAAVQRAMYSPQRPPYKLLTQDERIVYFGDPRPMQLAISPDGHFKPDPGWQSRSIIQVRFQELQPVPPSLQLSSFGIPLHHRVVPHFLRMWGLWRAAGLQRCLRTWNGSVSYRLSRSGSGRLSAHAFGIAFDINASFNPFKERSADVGEAGSVMELVNIAQGCGFFWGGHFQDGMHFEFADVSQLA